MDNKIIEPLENVQEVSKESTNPFDILAKQEQTKQDQQLANEIIQSGLLYTKQGREALGVKLQPYKREIPKTGRNEKCPCGSGVKFKKCCING